MKFNFKILNSLLPPDKQLELSNDENNILNTTNPKQQENLISIFDLISDSQRSKQNVSRKLKLLKVTNLSYFGLSLYSDIWL